MGIESRVVLQPGLIRRDVGEELFVLMPDSTVHWFKNATAVALIRAIAAAEEHGATIASLAGLLVSQFVVEPQVARSDVDQFVHQLRERHIAVVTTSPTNPAGGD